MSKDVEVIENEVVEEPIEVSEPVLEPETEVIVPEEKGAGFMPKIQDAGKVVLTNAALSMATMVTVKVGMDICSAVGRGLKKGAENLAGKFTEAREASKAKKLAKAREGELKGYVEDQTDPNEE